MHSSAHPEMDSTVSKCLNIQKDTHACRDLIIGLEGVKSESLHRRLCSRFAGVFWCRSVVISMLLVSFISHLLLHVQLGEVREVVRVQRDRIEDLMEVSHILLNEDTGLMPSFKTRSKLESQDQIQRSGTSRRARQKRHVPASPNFFFRGRSGVNPSTRAGVFLWETSSESFSDVNSFERAETNAGFVENVTVLAPGVYYVFATIVVHGRRPRNGQLEQSAVYPPMGAMLHRRKSGGEEEVLDVSFCTQDDRGAEFGYGLGDYPLDSVQLRGLYYLDFRDTIWVTKPTNMENNPKGETYHSEQTDMHFDLLWVKELCDDETFHPEWSGSFVKSVMIMKPGIYFVFAKIGVNGLANHSPYAPGLMLMKTHRRHGTNITLETAYLTQDNRGLPYTHQNNRPYSPLDTLPISGLFRLRKNEKLFVKVRDHPMGALYDLDGNHTHFGAFMVQTKDS